MSDTGNFGVTFLNSLFNNAKLVTKQPQPIYILHRDTIKTFMHEHRRLLSLTDRLLSLIGVEISIVLTLLTASFFVVFGIPSDTVKGIFISFAIGIGAWLLITLFQYLKERKNLSIDKIVDDLGKQGTVIQPNAETNSIPQPGQSEASAVAVPASVQSAAREE